MTSLAEILTEMAEYVQATHTVEVDRSYSTVAIIDRSTGTTDWFLQGEDAENFITIADDNWRDADTISQYVADCSVAKTYVDCL